MDTLGRKRPTGLLTLPGEDWSPPDKRPRNSYMTNLDGLCQGGPEGEKYPKTTRTGKATKTNKKEVWKSLVRASSSAQPTEEKKEEKREDTNRNYFNHMQLIHSGYFFHYHSEALTKQHEYCAGVSHRSATCNCE